MISYGFFNAVDGDRVYNAEDFNDYFEGLISSSGIFENVGGGFVVSPSSGLTVQIATGKARVENYFVKSDAIETLTVGTAHNLFSRYDAIVLKKSESSRDITLAIHSGTAASSPTKPLPTRASGVFEIVLAYVRVKPNATTITAADIEDARFNTQVCGVITGLIDQVDTTTLYKEYRAKFEELQAQMTAWEAAQETQFDTWFANLTEQLTVNTYIERTTANVTTTADNTTAIEIPASLGWTESDILEVFIGGVLFVENLDYTFVSSGAGDRISIRMGIDKDQVVTFYCYKSKIGWSN